MALNIGELFGTIGLDATAWDKELAGAQDNLKAFGVAGAAIAGAAAIAIGAALSKGIADSMDMNAGNDELKASLGLTVDQAATAGAAAGNLYAQNFGESLEATRLGVEAVMSSISGMRDASQADVEDMAGRMLTLADTMGIDVARAAQVAGQMMTTGLATDGVNAADLLTKAMQSVPVNVREDILDAADEYGPFFANLGISGEKAMGMLVAASEQGMYGIDKTGDALKEFGIRATDMSKASGEAYDAIGLSQEDMTNKLLAGGPTAAAAFQDIVAGVQGIENPADKAAAAIALFGTPLEDLSVTEIPTFLQSLTDAGGGLAGVAGASEQAMSDVASNAKAGFEGFQRQAQMALVDFVQVNIMPSLSMFAGFLNTTVGPALTQLGDWITTNLMPALQAFGSWFSENQGTIGLVAGVIGALLIPVFIRLAIQAGLSAAATAAAWGIKQAGAIKTAAIYVAQSYKMIGSFVATAVSMAVNAARVVAGWVLMGAQATAQGVKIAAVWTGSVIASAARGAATMAVQAARVVASWVLMGAQSLIHAARMAAAWVIAMGPIGWIITAVVGLVALIIANWDTVKAWTITAFTAVWSFMQAAWAGIVSTVTTAAAAVWNAIQVAFEFVKSIFTGVWDFIVGYYTTIWGLLTGQSTGAADQVRQIIATAFEAVKSFIMGIWDSIIGFLAGAWNNIKSTAINVFNAIVSFVSGLPGRFLAGLAAIGNLAAKMGQWIGGVKDAAVNKFLDLVGWVGELPGKILSSLGDLGGLLKNAGIQIITGFLDGLKQKYEDVKGFVTGIGDWIADHKGPKAYDLALLVPAGGWIMTGLEKGLRSQMGSLKGTLGDVSSMIESGVQPELAVTGSYSGTGGWAGQRDYGHATAAAPTSRSTTHAPITIVDSSTPYATAVKVSRVLERAV